jgi:hypothetical protein
LEPWAVREALEVARVPLAAVLPLRVSWWQGRRGGAVVGGGGRQTYRRLEDLAGDLRADMLLAAPKGTGRVLVGAIFGDPEAPDGWKSPEALGEAPRQLQHAACWTLAVVDLDHHPERGTPAPTVAEVARDLARAGLAAVVAPSPSALGPVAEARGVHALVPLAPVAFVKGEPGPLAAAGRAALPLLLRGLLGLSLDAGPLGPTGCCYVHPRGSPRSASDVFALSRGAALDLEALGEWALARAIVAAPRKGRRSVDHDGAQLLALATRAGLVLGAPDARGWVPTRCPRELEHSGPGAAGGCAVHPALGRWVCQHAHSGASERRGARQGTAVLVRWASELHPAAAEGLELEPVRGMAAALRAELDAAAQASGRTVALCSVVDDGAEAAGAASPTRAPLLRYPVGSGKTAIAARVVAAQAPPPREDLGAWDPSANPKPAAAVVVHTRERIPDTVRALVTVGAGDGCKPRRFLPLVSMPVLEHLAADGSPLCVHAARAQMLTAAGVAVRPVLCRDEGGKGSPSHSPCERQGHCPAERDRVPWGVHGDGTVGALPGCAGADGEPVLVVTHAGAPRAADLRAAAPVVIDEACAEPWEPVPLDAATLTAAGTMARWLAPAGDRDVPLGAAAVLHALAANPEALELPPGARRAWCEDRAAAGGRGVPGVAGWRAFTEGRGRFLLRQRAPFGKAGATLGWPGGGPRGGAAPVPGGAAGGAGLRAVRAWARGAAVAITGGGAAPLVRAVLVPTPSTELAQEAPVVVGLDATGTEAVWRAMVGSRGCVEPVHVEGGADVARVLVATGRAGAASLQVYGAAAPTTENATARGVPCAVRWHSAEGRAAAEVLRAAWAELRRATRASPPGEDPEGAGVTRQLLARTLAAWWALVGEDRAGAVREACGGKGGALWEPGVRRALDALCDDAQLDTLRRDLRAWRAQWPRWRWTWWGSTLTRGSDELRGVRALVSLGDPMPRPEVAAQRAAVTGEDPEASGRALAREALAQWMGRARHLRRAGEPLALVHIGRLAPDGWSAGVRVVDLAAALAPRPVTAADRDVARARAASTPGAGALACALDALRAGGLRWEHIAANLGVHRNTVRAWAQGATPADPGVVPRVEALAAKLGGPAAPVRAELAAILRHRTLAAVWRGASSARAGAAVAPEAGLLQLLRRARVAPPPGALDDLARFVEGAEPAAWVLPALAAPVAGSAACTVLELLAMLRPPPPSWRPTPPPAAVPAPRPAPAPTPPRPLPGAALAPAGHPRRAGPEPPPRARGGREPAPGALRCTGARGGTRGHALGLPGALSPSVSGGPTRGVVESLSAAPYGTSRARAGAVP